MTPLVLTIVVLLALALFIVWAELMYYFAGKDKQVVFGIIYAVGMAGLLISTALSIISSFSILQTLMGALILFFIIFVGATLYEQAGNKEKRWYYLTLIFPILALVYQFTKR